MTIQQQREKHCQELSEMFEILPDTMDTDNKQLRWARSVLLELIAQKMECLHTLDKQWR